MRKFEDFPTGNESARFIVNPFWLEHLLNLWSQGYVIETWEEICDTIKNGKSTMMNVSLGIIITVLPVKRRLNLYKLAKERERRNES